jgi:hypothetical protein
VRVCALCACFSSNETCRCGAGDMVRRGMGVERVEFCVMLDVVRNYCLVVWARIRRNMRSIDIYIYIYGMLLLVKFVLLSDYLYLRERRKNDCPVFVVRQVSLSRVPCTCRLQVHVDGAIFSQRRNGWLVQSRFLPHPCCGRHFVTRNY